MRTKISDSDPDKKGLNPFGYKPSALSDPPVEVHVWADGRGALESGQVGVAVTLNRQTGLIYVQSNNKNKKSAEDIYKITTGIENFKFFKQYR